MKLESLTFSDRYDILLEKKLSSVAGLMYIMLYGKSQVKDFSRYKIQGRGVGVKIKKV